MSNVSTFVLRHRALAPNRIAVDLGNSVVTYDELGRLTDQLAERLRASGLGLGELLLLTGSDELSLLVGALGTAAAGGSFAMLRRSMSPVFVRDRFGAMGPRFILTDRPDTRLAGMTTLFIDISGLRSDVAAARASISSAVPLSNHGTNPFCLMVGSGSTGAPKIFVASHSEEIALLEARITALSLSPADQVASYSHLEFASSLRHSLAALAAGSTLKLYPKDRETFVADLMHSNVTVLNVPVMALHTLLGAFRNAQGVLPALRFLGAGNAQISETLRHETDRHLTRHLHVLYGTNELGLMTMAPPEVWRRSPGTIGRPIPGVELQIVDTEGRRVSDGNNGLMRFRKHSMLTAYVNAPELTERSFRDGWFYPMDVGSVAADGLTRFLGRADDLMIFNGINIYPAEIEMCLRTLPGLRDVAAIPLSHPVHQDVPVCVVVLEEGAHLSAEHILEWGKPRLGVASPRKIFILDAIPRDEQGKLLRPQLRKMLAELVGRKTKSN